MTRGMFNLKIKPSPFDCKQLNRSFFFRNLNGRAPVLQILVFDYFIRYTAILVSKLTVYSQFYLNRMDLVTYHTNVSM